MSLFATCCLSFSCSSVPSQGPVARGDIAPDFTCNDQAGKQQRLSALRGKVVLVNFWATWCSPCREELPSLQALQKKFPSNDLVILALSVDDSWEPINRFMAQHQFTIPVYADFDKKISSRYGTVHVSGDLSGRQTRQGRLQSGRSNRLDFIGNAQSFSMC